MRISDWSSDVCSSDLANRVARVVREHQEGAAERNQAAVQRDAVHRRRHAEFAHAVVDVVAGELAGAQRDVTLEVGAVRFAKIGRSEEHTSELQSLMRISYAVFCLKKKKQQ